MINIEQYVYGMDNDGQAVVVYKMSADNGSSVEICNLGATILSVNVPDRNGEIGDVVLGYPDYENFLRDTAYVGRSVGRVANRIANGRMTIAGKEYFLECNDGANHLHGGRDGFARRIWDSRTETNRVVMTLHSEDGDQGYPGAVDAETIFDFDGESLELTFRVVSDQTTIVNMTNHAYFNLAGINSKSILDHELKLCCSHVLEATLSQIPSGESLATAGTPMDFSEFKPLSQAINSDFNLAREFHGLDHFFEVDDYQPSILAENAVLRDHESGRMMTVLSSAPGLQIYSGSYLAGGSPIAKDGERFSNYQGVALECQVHPNAVNTPNFPSVELKSGELYCQKIVFKFETF